MLFQINAPATIVLSGRKPDHTPLSALMCCAHGSNKENVIRCSRTKYKPNEYCSAWILCHLCLSSEGEIHHRQWTHNLFNLRSQLWFIFGMQSISIHILWKFWPFTMSPYHLCFLCFRTHLMLFQSFGPNILQDVSLVQHVAGSKPCSWIWKWLSNTVFHSIKMLLNFFFNYTIRYLIHNFDV